MANIIITITITITITIIIIEGEDGFHDSMIRMLKTVLGKWYRYSITKTPTCDQQENGL